MRIAASTISAMDQELISSFYSLLCEEVAVPVAAMNSLVLFIQRSEASTWMQLEKELIFAIECLKQSSTSLDSLRGRTTISLGSCASYTYTAFMSHIITIIVPLCFQRTGSGCELFMKYVTRSFSIEEMEFNACKQELVRRGEKFAGISLKSRCHIADIGHSFIQDDCTVLVHGNSRVVAALVLKAALSKTFNVILTEGRPMHDLTSTLQQQFADAGIPTKIVPDSAVAAVMEQVDLCLVGAEGVMENGGIINKLGTFQLSIVAKALNKPFYVAVESYKFARMYPLSQRDVAELCNSNDSVDFTPAEFITLLFTDLGVLTPAAVSDELIRLYQ